MRIIAILPLLCMVASVVLTVLCLLAGYQSTFMTNFELLTFNTSLLGEAIVNVAANDALSQLPVTLPSGIVSAIATRTIDIPPSVTSFIPPALQSAVAEVNGSTLLQTIARKLNIHDFYSLHILDFCEGYYEPGPIPNGTFTNPTQNITYCSPPKAFSFFNATDVLTTELQQGLTGVSLDQLQFPDEVQQAINAMAITQKAMFVLYCVGIGIGGLAAIQAILAFLMDGRLGAGCGIFLDILAFIAVGVASGCATAFIYVVTNAVNQYGAQANIQAYKGTNFLILTWIATVLPLIAAVLWCIDCCAGPDRKKRGKIAY